MCIDMQLPRAVSKVLAMIFQDIHDMCESMRPITIDIAKLIAIRYLNIVIYYFTCNAN